MLLRRLHAVVKLCALLLCAVSAFGFQKTNNDAVLKKARAAYYSLHAEGMTGFRCDMTPNWMALLEGQGVTDKAALDATVAKLNQLHFVVTVDEKGNAQVQHNEVAAENDKVKEGLKQIYSGMEQMTTGFFQTWSVFVVSPALPDPGTEFALASEPKQYRITYKDGNADVATEMDKLYTIRSVQATTSDFDSVIRPQFLKTPKGLLMNAYQAEYRTPSGEGNTDLQIAMDYQEVGGLQLPKILHLSGTYNNSPFRVEVVFSNCSLSGH